MWTEIKPESRFQVGYLRVFVLFLFWGHDHIGNSGVGNAVLGVPQVLCTCKPYQTAAFGGRNAEDGVPYGCLNF